MISIADNHRLLYKNAVLRAYDYENRSTPIRFYNADGVDIGETLRTNESGYLASSQGTHQVTSYFVKKKAIIQVSLDNGASWPIEYVVDTTLGSDDVGDGGLLSESGVRKWSANAKHDYTLDYKDLANKPDIKPWAEAEQCENCSGTDTISVNQFVKVLHLLGNPSDVHIVPSLQNRYGQHVTVFNDSTNNVNVYNGLGVLLFTLGVYEAREVFSQYTNYQGTNVLIYRKHWQLGREDIPVFPDYLFQRNKCVSITMAAGVSHTIELTPVENTVGVGVVTVTGYDVGERTLLLKSSNIGYGGVVAVDYKNNEDSVLKVRTLDGAFIVNLYPGEKCTLQVNDGVITAHTIADDGLHVRQLAKNDMSLSADGTWVNNVGTVLYPRKSVSVMHLDCTERPAAAIATAINWYIPEWASENGVPHQDYAKPIYLKVSRYHGGVGALTCYVRILNSSGEELLYTTIQANYSEITLAVFFDGTSFKLLTYRGELG